MGSWWERGGRVHGERGDEGLHGETRRLIQAGRDRGLLLCPPPMPVLYCSRFMVGTRPCLSRRAYEDWVFKKVKSYSKARSKASASGQHEPKRNKTAWDAMLDEMEWLAKDFMR